MQWRRIDPLLSLLNLDNKIYIYLTDQSRKFLLTVWKDWKLQTVYKEQCFLWNTCMFTSSSNIIIQAITKIKKKKENTAYLVCKD